MISIFMKNGVEVDRSTAIEGHIPNGRKIKNNVQLSDPNDKRNWLVIVDGWVSKSTGTVTYTVTDLP